MAAIWMRLRRDKYLLFWNSFSSSRSCILVYAVRMRLFLLPRLSSCCSCCCRWCCWTCCCNCKRRLSRSPTTQQKRKRKTYLEHLFLSFKKERLQSQTMYLKTINNNTANTNIGNTNRTINEPSRRNVCFLTHKQKKLARNCIHNKACASSIVFTKDSMQSEP